jgi:hypothetical protein
VITNDKYKKISKLNEQKKTHIKPKECMKIETCKYIIISSVYRFAPPHKTNNNKYLKKN